VLDREDKMRVEKTDLAYQISMAGCMRRDDKGWG
jgi:hypothetical protein